MFMDVGILADGFLFVLCTVVMQYPIPPHDHVSCQTTSYTYIYLSLFTKDRDLV